MATSKMVKAVLDDINKTIKELYSKGIVRDYLGVSANGTGKNSFAITYSGKNSSSSVVYDKHITVSEIMDVLLKELQYTVLLYDKSLFQAEFEISDNKIIKERLVFIKKHNRIWNMKEIEEYESTDEDWFAEQEGIPIMIRIDFAPKEHVEGKHAATHLTISNHESCRVPVKGIVSFSEFVRFVLLHFYDINLDIKVCRLDESDTITKLEKQMIHINWE